MIFDLVLDLNHPPPQIFMEGNFVLLTLSHIPTYFIGLLWNIVIYVTLKSQQKYEHKKQ